MRHGRHCASRPPRDQAGALEHAEVLRDRGHAHREWRRQLGDRALARGEAGEDGSTGRIGEGGKRDAEVIGRHGRY